MNKLINKLWILIIALLFVINCDSEADGTSEDVTTPSVIDVKIDILSIYEMRKGDRGTYVFQNSAQLTSFLEATGYDEKDTNRITVKMAHQPDFNKWTYFAIAESCWPCDIKDVSLVGGTITVNYTNFRPPIDDFDGPQYVFVPPVVRIYFIPYTEKTIEFAEIAVGPDGSIYSSGL